MPSRREGPPDPLGKRALFWVPPVTEGSAEPAFVEGIDEEPAYGGERTTPFGRTTDGGWASRR